MNFNYEIINEEFENDKVWVVILKFSTLTTLKTIVEFDLNTNLKIFDLLNNKFKPILNFQMKYIYLQMKYIYPNTTLHNIIVYKRLPLDGIS